MDIKVLGTGCAKCKKLYEVTEEAAKKSGKDFEMTKVTELADIMSYGVMMTPALVVDGEVKSTGKIPTEDELADILG